MSHRMLSSVALTLAVAMPHPATAQTATRDPLTIERIFTKREFATAPAGWQPWLDDVRGSTRLEPSRQASGLVDLVATTAAGVRTTLVAATELVPLGGSRPLRIVSYALSAGHSRLLFSATGAPASGSEATWWVMDLGSRQLTQVGASGLPGRVVAPQLSPDGSHVAYASDHNLYVEAVATSIRRQLTQDGSPTRINGDSPRPFAAVNNTKGFRWSPDGSRLAYVQFDMVGVRSVLMVNNVDFLYPQVDSFQHVKPGATLPASRVGVVSIDGGATSWVELPGDPRMNYLTTVEWAASASELVVQQFDRHQNRMTVFLMTLPTGSPRAILTETDPAFLDPVSIQWIGGGRHFLWMTERDGWRHVYRHDRDGSQPLLVTRGNFDVASIERIDEAGGWLYYLASPDNAIYRYLYRTRLDGSGMPERVTPTGAPGTHSYSISPSGQWAFHSYSRFDTPPVSEVVALPTHRVVRTVQDNAALRARLDAVARAPYEFLKVDIGNGVRLDAWCIKPPDFDPSKQYPVIFHEYSMPGGQFVTDSWKGDNYLFYLMLAQRGFVVMAVDSRGTPSLYGRAWRKIIYQNHGILPSDDIAAAAKVLLAERPYLDAKRVGAYGWSGGGLISMLLLLRHGDVFKAAVPGAFISDHRYYEAGFTERYLGLPQESPAAYDKAAALRYAKNLTGDLLILHGTADDNVHYQNMELMVDALIATGKHFAVVPYPNRSHGMAEGINTKAHQHDTLLWFFTEHFRPGGGASPDLR
ncbi:MAG: DPP IV N-terminal domain-containing protein [Gemmatimonadetes bacterium]|nr:DPP IV N-terminal domain-containing protein [Gemmatimonadota bacterium]